VLSVNLQETVDVMVQRVAIPLTNRSVLAAEPRGNRYCVWDRDLPGFGMRVEPSGAKIFFARYRAHGGGRRADQKLVTIGRLGILTPEQARKKARVILAEAIGGSDPAAEIKARRKLMKVSELVGLYEIKEKSDRKEPLTSIAASP
jgi:hypothetical protein